MAIAMMTVNQNKVEETMHLNKKVIAGVVAAGIGLTASAAFAYDIRVGITMRMVSENGQAYGQMVMDEIDGINASGGIN